MSTRETVVAAGEAASMPSAVSGARTMTTRISVSAMAAMKARTGDGPRYGRSSRRLRSIAWEPGGGDQPETEHDDAGEEQPAGWPRARGQERDEQDGAGP